jgi:hypothetical protein
MVAESALLAVLVVVAVGCTAVGVAFRRDPARFVAFEAATLGGDHVEGPARRAQWLETAGAGLIAIGLLAFAIALVWTFG